MPIRIPEVNGTRCSPAARMLASRAVVRPAALAQPHGSRFEHETLRHGDRAQCRRIGRRQMTRVEVRQQSGLLEHGVRGLGEIGQGRAMPEAGELVGGGAVAQLRLVAEREQRLLATGCASGPCDGQHFLDR
jgi:hypothetical protein